MRRWNGWGDETIVYHIPDNAKDWLAEHVGSATPPADTRLEDVAAAVPDSRLKSHPLVSTGAEDRVRHARGQSLPDWLDLRTGRIRTFPDGVAYPDTEDDLRTLFVYARQTGAHIIPYGGGTSVVGHINPEPDGTPSLVVDLSHFDRLTSLDAKSRLATFGAGVRGPHLEAALRAQGFMLGHFPQSFELSTLGGWIATRSSGQQSLHYGRIEHHFAGGRLVTPAGSLDMLPHAASAAGPDLRELVLGSEGRLGIISEATIRIHPLPDAESFHAMFFPTWEQGITATREMVQLRLPLSLLRLSDGSETEVNMTLAGHENLVSFAHRGLSMIGQQRGEKCMLLFGATGRHAAVREALRAARHIGQRQGGFYAGQYMGKTWRRSRFLTPYLRNTLWELGYAVDTLETIVPWSKVLSASFDISRSIEKAAMPAGEKVYVFAHLSHLYPTGASIYTTYIFRIPPDPDELLERWVLMKHAASRTVVQYGGTISHQHGVGADHAPYLEAEKGTLGMDLIRSVARCCDPDGLMNPGKLFDAEHTPLKQMILMG
jgi:alkyldihydroxyacetonephosphate synthase